MTDKKIVAVIFGGRSVEHDVSVLTGLQFLEALNPTLYIGLPVYVDPLGGWWTGDALTRRSHYPITDDHYKALTAVQLDLATTSSGRPRLIAREKGFFGDKALNIGFDIMVPAIHGSNGEDGTLQGLLEFSAVPYTGCRLMGSALTMDKVAAKSWARQHGLPVLPELMLARPKSGHYLDEDGLKEDIKTVLAGFTYPYCVKPCNLGSSVGVSKADDFDGLMASLIQVFRIDSEAMIEPFVPNLAEYNIAVRRNDQSKVQTSAIERPSSDGDLLDFKNKYLSGDKGGPKLDTAPSEGMASLNRTLNPQEIDEKQEKLIRSTASALFDGMKLAGSVRIDFLCDSKSGEIWFNEVNTIPGSFAYFLWEGAEPPVSFLELTGNMIEEGFTLSANRLGNTSAGAGGSMIFKE